MARKATVLGQAEDFDGGMWDIREIRPTSHGFQIYIGWPAGRRGQGWGGPRVIPTIGLVSYWESNRLSRDGRIYNLPISRTTIKRVRQLLGLDYYCDNTDWWLERLEDLAEMSGAKFATLHGVSQVMVSKMHTRLLGRRIQKAGWWREDSNAELIRSDLPRAFVADRLGVSIGAVGKLRWMLRREYAHKNV